MAMAERNQMAADIWPHLAADRPAPRQQPHERNLWAERMYPNLTLKHEPNTAYDYEAYSYENILLRHLEGMGLRRKGR
jgi:hypothetical protein